MAHYRLKKGQTIGALAAESDQLLNRVFVDTGYSYQLTDTNDPHFLIMGRTGSGKTALIRNVKERAEHASGLDPDELSMQYLHSNPILNRISEWGIHLDIFFKFLWRHICVLELIKMRYSGDENLAQMKNNILSLLFSDQKKTQNVALQYLDRHGQEYWITADTHIKAFATDLESKIKGDSSIGGKIGLGPLGVGLKTKEGSEETSRQHVEMEIKERAQSIVNDYQVAALNEVVERMSKNAFNDPQKKYYLVIDDLDKNWMPDDSLYLDLLKSLLYTVKELNQKLQGVKILVAMRTNIFFRIFKKTKQTEPQREKWFDVIREIRWSRSDLEELVNKRLGEVFREQYTNNPPTLTDILPKAKRGKGVEALDYILERTFYRPRDVIAFINTCIEQSEGGLDLTWSRIERAESEYSKHRLRFIIDEWKDSYFGLPALFPLLQRKGHRFRFDDVMDADVNEVLSHSTAPDCPWLTNLNNQYCSDKMSFREIKRELINALYHVGIIGFKNPSDNKVEFSFDHPLDMIAQVENMTDSTMYVHKMFWRALNIGDHRTTK